jgi:2-methylaconitate cis-trans-isomerase PrpF
MAQARIRASFMRGGTSKAVMFRREDLPADPKDWDQIFIRVMGSPDPNGRQLDGMGGGLSSLSKVCIVGPSTRSDADVDYTFGQVSIRNASVDYNGNCGNMSSAIGPFAVEEGIVAAPTNGTAVVRIHNTNTSKIIIARFPVENGVLAVNGDLILDGVSGSAAPIRLEFLDPGGAKTGKLLPSGLPRDTFDIPGLCPIEVSCVDAANPCAFVAAHDLVKEGGEPPDVLERDATFLGRMESIRCAASVAMGIAPNATAAAAIASIPKVAIVSSPRAMRTLSGHLLAPGDADIGVRMISVGQPHRAIPITGAICLAVAVRIPGSIPNAVSTATAKPIRIAQPSGVTVVDASVIAAPDRPSGVHAEFGAVYRTARRLFEGQVLYRPVP